MIDKVKNFRVSVRMFIVLAALALMAMSSMAVFAHECVKFQGC